MWCHFRPLLSPLDSWCHGWRVALQSCFLWIHLFIASVKKATSPQDSPEGLQWVLGRDQSWGRVGAPAWGSWGGSACRKGGSGGAFSLSPDPWEESAASWGWFLLSSNKWQDKGKQPWSVLGRSRLNIGENFLVERMVRYWKRLARAVHRHHPWGNSKTWEWLDLGTC